ncbi:MAG TPA: hypothetical protein VH188_13995 [Chthoniobacterales bacterium]|jgi:hypothetical protein|nr:hypothetical protein [Chthoniobacterales bacterium]
MSAALSKVIQFTDAVSGLVPSSPVARIEPTPDPMAVLVDLRLPSNILETLAPILQGLGFSWDEVTLTDNVGFNDQRKITRCRLNDALECFLAYIPSWILERNTKADNAAVDFLRHSFDAGGRIYIVSEGVQSLKIAFIGTFQSWRQQSQITAHLLPWNLLQELKDAMAAGQALLPLQRTNFLKIVFKLDQPGIGGGPAVAATLNDAERKEFAAILAKQASGYALGPKSYYSDLLRTSNLPQQWEDQRIAALGGLPEADAAALVQWAINTGRNTKEGRQFYTVLAEFVGRMMETVGLEDQKTLMRWVLTKPLIFDDAARKALRQKFPVDIT